MLQRVETRPVRKSRFEKRTGGFRPSYRLKRGEGFALIEPVVRRWSMRWARNQEYVP